MQVEWRSRLWVQTLGGSSRPRFDMGAAFVTYLGGKGNGPHE